MVERRSHEDRNNGHPDHGVRTVLDVPALCVGPRVKRIPSSQLGGVEGAFHLQECVSVC